MLEPQGLTADDFMTGMLAALALGENIPPTIRSGERLDRAFAMVFSEDLGAEAAQHKLSLAFRIRPHPIHGDSPTVRDALSAAAGRRLISWDSPELVDFRLQIAPGDAEAILSRLPGSADMYNRLAARLLECYQ